MHGNEEKNGWHVFYLRIFSHFYEFSPWWHVSIQLSSTNLRWTWFTYNSKANRTSMTLWLGHDHLTFTHLSCIQPLHVNCFKPFKFAFENKNESNMIRTIHSELDKPTLLANWVDKTLNQWLSKQSIKNEFKATWIWPFNPTSMDSRTRSSDVYTTKPNMWNLNEACGNSNDASNASPQWGEDGITKLMNMGSMSLNMLKDNVDDFELHGLRWVQTTFNKAMC